MAQDGAAGKGAGLPEGGKARRVYLLLQEEILHGQYAPGTALEGEQKLATRLGVSLLALRRVVMDAKGRGVEYLSALNRPDMFRLEMSLHRVGTDGTRHWEAVIDVPVTEAAA